MWGEITGPEGIWIWSHNSSYRIKCLSIIGNCQKNKIKNKCNCSLGVGMVTLGHSTCGHLLHLSTIYIYLEILLLKKKTTQHLKPSAPPPSPQAFLLWAVGTAFMGLWLDEAAPVMPVTDRSWEKPFLRGVWATLSMAAAPSWHQSILYWFLGLGQDVCNS